MRKLNTFATRACEGAVVLIDGAHYVVEDARWIGYDDVALGKHKQYKDINPNVNFRSWRVVARRLKPNMTYDPKGRLLTFYQASKPFRRARFERFVDVAGQMKKTVTYS